MTSSSAENLTLNMGLRGLLRYRISKQGIYSRLSRPRGANFNGLGVNRRTPGTQKKITRASLDLHGSHGLVQDKLAIRGGLRD